MVATGKNRPILLKNSDVVSTGEKYASEIEILTFGRGYRAWISRSNVQQRCFHRSICGWSGRTDFFNRIGQKRTVCIINFSPFFLKADPGSVANQPRLATWGVY